MERAWVIRVGSEAVDVQDLPAREIARIAKETEHSWFDVVATPLADLSVALELVTLAAAQAGVPEPEDLSSKAVMEMFDIEERPE